MINKDLRDFQFYAGTVAAPRSQTALTRLIKRACYGIFPHVAAGHEQAPHSHCHILVAGHPTHEQLAKFQRRLPANSEVWLKQLTTFEAVGKYRDYALGIGHHKDKAIMPILLIQTEIFCSPAFN
jgi:hypothetical protein